MADKNEIVIVKSEMNLKALSMNFKSSADELYSAIVNFVKYSRGYINFCDNMELDIETAIGVDATNGVFENIIRAVKVEDGLLSVFLVPMEDSNVVWSNEDIASEDYADYWYSVTRGSELFFEQTLYHLAYLLERWEEYWVEEQ